MWAVAARSKRAARGGGEVLGASQLLAQVGDTLGGGLLEEPGARHLCVAAVGTAEDRHGDGIEGTVSQPSGPSAAHASTVAEDRSRPARSTGSQASPGPDHHWFSSRSLGRMIAVGRRARRRRPVSDDGARFRSVRQPARRSWSASAVSAARRRSASVSAACGALAGADSAPDRKASVAMLTASASSGSRWGPRMSTPMTTEMSSRPWIARSVAAACSGCGAVVPGAAAASACRDLAAAVSSREVRSGSAFSPRTTRAAVSRSSVRRRCPARPMCRGQPCHRPPTATWPAW